MLAWSRDTGPSAFNQIKQEQHQHWSCKPQALAVTSLHSKEGQAIPTGPQPIIAAAPQLPLPVSAMVQRWCQHGDTQRVLRTAGTLLLSGAVWGPF